MDAKQTKTTISTAVTGINKQASPIKAGVPAASQKDSGGIVDKILEKAPGFADLLTSVATTKTAEKFFGFTASQKNLLDKVGDVTDGLGILYTGVDSALAENGGLKNTINGITNARSNLNWLQNSASDAQRQAFATDADAKTKAVLLNIAYAPVFDGIELMTGKKYSWTGENYQSFGKSILDTYMNGIQKAGGWLYDFTGF